LRAKRLGELTGDAVDTGDDAILSTFFAPLLFVFLFLDVAEVSQAFDGDETVLTVFFNTRPLVLSVVETSDVSDADGVFCLRVRLPVVSGLVTFWLLRTTVCTSVAMLFRFLGARFCLVGNALSTVLGELAFTISPSALLPWNTTGSTSENGLDDPGEGDLCNGTTIENGLNDPCILDGDCISSELSSSFFRARRLLSVVDTLSLQNQQNYSALSCYTRIVFR